MTTITFLVNDAQVNGNKTNAWVAIEEADNGSLLFKIKLMDNIARNLYGIYLEITDESIMKALRVSAVSYQNYANEDSMNYLRNGTDSRFSNVNNERREITAIDPRTGKQNAAMNKVKGYSFLLRCKTRVLSLCDFSHLQFDYTNDYANSCIAPSNEGSHRRIYLRLM
ncbi:MAG: hypothetical protein E6Q62_07565 [Nitrosomonas sp.]|nr:MAG: hypothetical protein E6Q62_07565 [Nitrosomonas sp.]